jgi:hypothetical protein
MKFMSSFSFDLLFWKHVSYLRGMEEMVTYFTPPMKRVLLSTAVKG